MEAWYNLPLAIRLITPQPEYPLIADADASTAFYKYLPNQILRLEIGIDNKI